MADDTMIKEVLEEAKGIYAPQKEFQRSMYAQTVDPKKSQPDALERGMGSFVNDVATIATPPTPPGGPTPENYNLAGAIGLRDNASPPPKIPIGIGGTTTPPSPSLQILGTPNPNGPSDLQYKEGWRLPPPDPTSPGIPGWNQGFFEPPFAEGVKNTAATPPSVTQGGQGGPASANTSAENNPPSWVTKNGWNISNEGKKDAKGIGITPMGEQPTAVRTSTKDRTGKGMMASVKLETDTKDTTLVANPNYNKMVVDDYGYGKRGMGGNAHIDNRKYIEKENWGKGEKVPLLQAMGFGKREEPQGMERAIKNIENDPNMRANGGMRDAGHKIIADLYGHQMTAQAHQNNMDERLSIMREANAQRGQQNAWTHEDRVEKQGLEEAQKFLDLNKAYDFNPETGKEDKVNNSLTVAKMLEASNGDVKQIPKVFRNQASNFQNRFEEYFAKGTVPPGSDVKAARRLAWAKFKEKFMVKQPE